MFSFWSISETLLGLVVMILTFIPGILAPNPNFHALNFLSVFAVFFDLHLYAVIASCMCLFVLAGKLLTFVLFVEKSSLARLCSFLLGSKVQHFVWHYTAIILTVLAPVWAAGEIFCIFLFVGLVTKMLDFATESIVVIGVVTVAGLTVRHFLNAFSPFAIAISGLFVCFIAFVMRLRQHVRDVTFYNFCPVGKQRRAEMIAKFPRAYNARLRFLHMLMSLRRVSIVIPKDLKRMIWDFVQDDPMLIVRNDVRGEFEHLILMAHPVSVALFDPNRPEDRIRLPALWVTDANHNGEAKCVSILYALESPGMHALICRVGVDKILTFLHSASGRYNASIKYFRFMTDFPDIVVEVYYMRGYEDMNRHVRKITKTSYLRRKM